MIRLFQIAAWLVLLCIAAATLSPMGLRPRLAGTEVSLEHIAAYAVVGLLFSVAYPRHVWIAMMVVIGAAFGFEVMQMLAPDRHARIVDAVQKAGGGLFGLGVGWFGAQVFTLR